MDHTKAWHWTLVVLHSTQPAFFEHAPGPGRMTYAPRSMLPYLWLWKQSMHLKAKKALDPFLPPPPPRESTLRVPHQK